MTGTTDQERFSRTIACSSRAAELQLYPPIGHGEHILLPGAVTVWQTAVESFLAKVGLDQLRN